MKKNESLISKYKADLVKAQNTVAQKQQEFLMAQGIVAYLQQELAKLEEEVNQEGGMTE